VIRARRLGRGAIAAALAVCAANGVATATTTREALIAHWATVNHRPARLLESIAPVVATPPPDLRELAARELAVPGRYRLESSTRADAHLQRGLPWWLRPWSWLRDRWKQLWSTTFGHTQLSRSSAIAIGDVLIAGALVLILFVAYRMLVEVAYERRSSRPRSTEPLLSTQNARTLYNGACERARKGEYGAASSQLFAATICALAHRGLVRDDRTATVGDFRRTLQQRDAALLSFFDVVSTAFVTSAYAELPVEGPQWERARLAYLCLADNPES
jgi:hypothetical protein